MMEMTKIEIAIMVLQIGGLGIAGLCFGFYLLELERKEQQRRRRRRAMARRAEDEKGCRLIRYQYEQEKERQQLEAAAKKSINLTIKTANADTAAKIASAWI